MMGTVQEAQLVYHSNATKTGVVLQTWSFDPVGRQCFTLAKTSRIGCNNVGYLRTLDPCPYQNGIHVNTGLESAALRYA